MIRRAKYLFALLLLIASGTWAQTLAPVIARLEIDEMSKVLSIKGQFGKDSGSVHINSTTLDVLSWSDTLILCMIDDSGDRAAGDVRVLVGDSLSNVRRITEWSADLAINVDTVQVHGPGDLYHYHWRADLGGGFPDSVRAISNPGEVIKFGSDYDYGYGWVFPHHRARVHVFSDGSIGPIEIPIRYAERPSGAKIGWARTYNTESKYLPPILLSFLKSPALYVLQIGKTLSLSISWSLLPGAERYELQVSRDSFATVIVDDTLARSYVTQTIPDTGTYWTRVQGFDQFGTGPWSKTSIVHIKNVELRVDEASRAGFAVWPNPTNGVCNLSLGSEFEGALDVTIVDETGKTVLSRHCESGVSAVKLDLQKLSPGLYYLQACSSKGKRIETALYRE